VISTIVEPGGTPWPSPSNPQVNETFEYGIAARNSPLMTSSKFGTTRNTPPGRGSSSTSVPIHCIIFAGSVRKP
jgi:hypothetical protein